MKFISKLIFLLVFINFTGVLNYTLAQPKGKKNAAPQNGFQQQLELANEYLAREDFEKAAAVYEKMLKDDFQAYAPALHENYLRTLKALKQTKTTDRYLNKMVKTFDAYATYKVDLILFYAEQKEDKAANKLVERLADEIRNSPMEVSANFYLFLEKEKYDWAEQLILTSRKALGQPEAYMQEAAELYKAKGRTDEMLLELLTYLDKQYGNLYTVQMILQQNLSSEEDYQALERILLKRLQTESDKIYLNELLYWVFVQRKDFTGALQQAKAIDKRNKNNGGNSQKVLELATLAKNNKSYEQALEAYLYLSANANSDALKNNSEVRALEIKELLVKNTYPVEIAKVRDLIKDYQLFIAKNPSVNNQVNPNTLEAYRSIGLLYAWYLSNPDSAIINLEKVATAPRGDRNLIDRAKLELGDVFVLKEIFWEATLLYSQVEKTQKETALGHEAKLRNARLSFYKGEFVLASEHLDVLKAATTREISNDAMDLGLLIQDNTVFDTTGADLKRFARIELLRFQHRYEEALSELKSLENSTSEAGLKDEILWSRVQIYNALQQFDSSIAVIETILKTYPDGLYADDALFEKGRILSEIKLQNTEAMAVYEQLISRYPGSIFVVESRKRYRNLRGDKVN